MILLTTIGYQQGPVSRLVTCTFCKLERNIKSKKNVKFHSEVDPNHDKWYVSSALSRTVRISGVEFI